ncbi:MAG TPA: trypsin-like peptidase domain-containing protein, partial [Kangiella sp.]
INRSGFSINQNKTRYQTYKEKQVVTGVKVNKKLNVDRKYIRTTRAMIHSLSKGITQLNYKYQKQNHLSLNQSLLPTVLGRLHYIKMIKGHNSTVFITLAKKLNNLNLGKTVNIDRSEHGRLQHSYPFYKEENRKRLESCVWILEFSDVTECNIDEQLVQGTAFMLIGQRLMTASHVFKKAGNPDYCYVRRVNEKNKKYKAIIISDNPASDIAELKIETEEKRKFNYLKVASNITINPGYEVAVVGFPEFRESQDFVSIKACRVINNHVFSTFEHKEVDIPIHSGNSGGPVVDGYMNVVGMAVTGVDVAYFTNQGQEQNDADDGTIDLKSNGRTVKHRIKQYLEIPDKFITRNDIKKEVERRLSSIETTVQLEGLNAFISSKYL